MLMLLQANFFGDANLGMYAKVTENFCIIGNSLAEKYLPLFEKTFQVKAFRSSVAFTEIIGIFLAANSNGIILPKIVAAKELENFKKFSKEHELNLLILQSKQTAIGNLILCNNKGAIISKNFSRNEKKQIADCLAVETEFSDIAGLRTVGACGVATNNGCLLHRDATEEEIKNVQSVLKVTVDIGTANFGSPFVGSCILANSKGILIGAKTTGPEIVRIQEALKS
jgi:translation initiation factor 6